MTRGVGRCPVSADLDRHHTDLLPRLGEERSGGVQVSALGRQDLDDLAVLIDGAVQVVPCPGDLDVDFVDEPPIPRCVPAGAGGVDEFGRERLHPPVDRHVIHDHAAFGEQFLDIALGQPVPEIPAHGHRDHLTREPISGRWDRQRRWRLGH